MTRTYSTYEIEAYKTLCKFAKKVEAAEQANLEDFESNDVIRFLRNSSVEAIANLRVKVIRRSSMLKAIGNLVPAFLDVGNTDITKILPELLPKSFEPGDIKYLFLIGTLTRMSDHCNINGSELHVVDYWAQQLENALKEVKDMVEKGELA